MRISYCLMLIALFLGMARTAEAADTFRWKVGAAEVILLSEGQSEGKASLLIGADEKTLKDYAPDGTFKMAMNAFLVRTPDMTVLVDTGLGRKLFTNLESVGVSPDEVDAVLITHMHGDHIGGLIRDGKTAFPRAKMYLAARERDYWAGGTKDSFDKAKDVLRVYKQATVTFTPKGINKGDTKVLPGIKAIAAFGHTPGHTLFLVESGTERLLIWGDLAHAMAVQMPNPGVSITYDVDPAAAAAARAEILKYAASENIPVAGMHIPYPAIGRIKKLEPGGYSFEPVE